jgi:hypothetical protein
MHIWPNTTLRYGSWDLRTLWHWHMCVLGVPRNFRSRFWRLRAVFQDWKGRGGS